MLNKTICYFLDNRVVTILLLLLFIGWGLSTAPFDWKTGFIPKDTLANDNDKPTQKFASTLLNNMARIDLKRLTNQEVHNYWIAISKEITASEPSISKTSNIIFQWNHFEHLPAHLIKAVKLFGVNQQIYEQFWPMAGNKEGYWLCLSKDIKNLCLSESMLTCGETKSTIK